MLQIVHSYSYDVVVFKCACACPTCSGGKTSQRMRWTTFFMNLLDSQQHRYQVTLFLWLMFIKSIYLLHVPHLKQSQSNDEVINTFYQASEQQKVAINVVQCIVQ